MDFSSQYSPPVLNFSYSLRSILFSPLDLEQSAKIENFEHINADFLDFTYFHLYQI